MDRVNCTRPTAQFSAFHTTADQWRRWRLAAFTTRRIAAFIVKMLRRRRRRRTFGSANQEADA